MSINRHILCAVLCLPQIVPNLYTGLQYLNFAYGDEMDVEASERTKISAPPVFRLSAGWREETRGKCKKMVGYYLGLP